MTFLTDYTTEQLKGMEQHLKDAIWRGNKFGWLEHMQDRFKEMLPEVSKEISKRSLKVTE